MPRSIFPTLVSLLAATAAAQGHSRLWGKTGELWDPRGRLPDYSYAGYHAGDRALPRVPVVADVKSFGAKGDGRTDDTAAFRKAIATARAGAILVPRGRYLLQGDLRIARSGVVLRGEGSGPNGAELYFTKSLADLYGARPQWSWNGGLIRVAPAASGKRLTAVAAPAVRGDTTLTLAAPVALAPGDLVVLKLTDEPGLSLGRHLHNDLADPGNCSWQRPVRLSWPVRVRAVRGKLLELAQPLRTDVRMAWRPEIHSAPFLTEVGIEHLQIRFPARAYAGHNREPGYNAIYFENGVADSWVRDVTIVDSDNGVICGRLSKNLEVRDVVLQGRLGHHGLRTEFAADCLFTGFDLRADRIHALTVNHLVNGCVFSEGRGAFPIEMDHHRNAPFENLFTDLRSATNYNSSGSWCAGPHAGARETFWNLAGTVFVPWLWGPTQTNVVGRIFGWNRLTKDREWYEIVANLAPRDLHLAQLARRHTPPPTRFGSDPVLGDRRSFRERDPARWRLRTAAGETRYELWPQGLPTAPAGRAAEYSLLRDRIVGDGLWSVRVRSLEDLATTKDADVCLIAGYQDDENYWVARFGATTAASGMWRVRAGLATRIAAASAPLLRDARDHVLALERRGSTLLALRDGKVVARAVDSTLRAGAPGFGSSGRRAAFDDVVLRATLSQSAPSVSLAAGGQVTFHLDAGAAHAGKLHLLAGSLSGTVPGLRLGSVTLPLNPDPYFDFTVTEPGLLIRGALGRLDAAGRARAVYRLPPGLDPGLVGRVAHHAFVVIGTASFDAVSAAVPLRFVP